MITVPSKPSNYVLLYGYTRPLASTSDLIATGLYKRGNTTPDCKLSTQRTSNMQSFTILFILSASSLLALTVASPTNTDMLRALIQSLMEDKQLSIEEALAISEANLQQRPVSEAVFQQKPVSEAKEILMGKEQIFNEEQRCKLARIQ